MSDSPDQKRVKLEPQSSSTSWSSAPAVRSNAKQRRAAARARGQGPLYVQRHYGQPAYVEQDKALIQKQIQASKNIPWEDVEALLEPGDIFTPENIESNPSYSQAATPVDDEPDSYDFLHQPSWDWRLLRVFWDTALKHSAANDPRIAPGAYPKWFTDASVKELTLLLRKPKRSLLLNIRNQRKIITNLGNKDRMPEFGVDALRWLYGNTWPYGKDADKFEDDDGEDYLDNPPNVADYRTFLASAEPAWVKYLLALREIAAIRASILSKPTDRRFSEGSFLRAVIRRASAEEDSRMDLENAEKDPEVLNEWARPRWVQMCTEFDKFKEKEQEQDRPAWTYPKILASVGVNQNGSAHPVLTPDYNNNNNKGARHENP